MQSNPSQLYTGFSNYPHWGNTQLSGEGNVAHIILPDGGVQYYFISTLRYQPPVCGFWPINSPNNSNCQWNTNNEVWFIKAICNPTLPPVYYQTVTSATPYCNWNNYETPVTGYYQKFHNDSWSSTTDLHYFCPSQKNNEWLLRYAPVPVGLEGNFVCHYGMISDIPCLCSSDSNKDKNSTQKCNKQISASNSRSMSVDELKVKPKLKNANCGWSDSDYFSNETKPVLNNVNFHTVDKNTGYSKTDKLVTTYMDQFCDCEHNNESQTQTNEIPDNKKAEVEMWYPKTNFSQKAMKPSSSCNNDGADTCKNDYSENKSGT